MKEHSRNKTLPGYAFPIEYIFFVTTSKILARHNVKLFEFLSKNILILFLNILSNNLIPNGKNVSGRSVILISILSSLLKKINESRN